MSAWMKTWKAPWSHNSGRFIPEKFLESIEELGNPARGWYQIYTFQGDVPFEPEETRWCLKTGEALVLVLVDISAYQKVAIDNAGLQNIRNILEWFGQQGKDVILRVVYDREGKGMEREPSQFELVKTHLEQIAGILRTLEKPIFLYQGLLVGSWGEMHSSRYLVKERLVQLEQILRNDSGNCFYGVRSPLLWRWLREEASNQQVIWDERMGIFDDGMLGSDTNLGTFGYEARSAESWFRPWCREDELQFLDELCRHVPCGGEAVFPENGELLKEHVQLLRAMHVTYLNRVHDRRILDMWRTWTWSSEDVWNGCNGYDYIGNHLGYRLVIRGVSAFPVRKSDSQYLLKIEIENVGFAKLYQDVELCLEWHTADKGSYVETIAFDLRTLDSGSKKNIEYVTKVQEGTVYLLARRKLDGALLRFANECEDNRKILLGTFTI